jgi:hypothetical protein
MGEEAYRIFLDFQRSFEKRDLADGKGLNLSVFGQVLNQTQGSKYSPNILLIKVKARRPQLL